MADTQKRPRSDSASSSPDSKRPNVNNAGMDVEPASIPQASAAAEEAPAAAAAETAETSKAQPSTSEPALTKNTYITIRALIVTQDASIIIGKGAVLFP